MTMAMSPINVFLGSCWSNEYCVGFFSGAGEEKMDPDKSVVFAYDGGASPPRFGHFRPTYTAYAFPLDIVEKDLSCLKATPKADISSPEI